MRGDKAASPTRAATARPSERQLAALKEELRAKEAEANWLKAHYEDQLRAAFAQVAALQAHLRNQPPEREHALAQVNDQEQSQLRAEIERLHAAEARYLDRIQELKESLATARRGLDQ